MNALPLDISLQASELLSINWVTATPRQLNDMMLNQQLDVSPVSSAFYLRHQHQLVCLNDISISAESPVESVLMWVPAHQPIRRLSIPDTSETSIALAQAILYARYQLDPKTIQYHFYAPGDAYTLVKSGHAVVAIGDEALCLNGFAPYPGECIDLAKAWLDLTGMPFVFAMWAAQAPWVQYHPETLLVLNALWRKAKDRFYFDPIYHQHCIDKAQQKSPRLEKRFIDHYLSKALSYNLDSRHLKGLSLFEDVLKWLDDESRQQQPPAWLSSPVSV